MFKIIVFICNILSNSILTKYFTFKNCTRKNILFYFFILFGNWPVYMNHLNKLIIFKLIRPTWVFDLPLIVGKSSLLLEKLKLSFYYRPKNVVSSVTTFS